MKKSFTQILAFCSIVLLMLASCKKDETKVVVSSNPTPGALTASTTNVALSKSTLTSNAVTFTSTTPNFGYSAAVTTTLQISPKGNNFATRKEVVFTGKTVSASYTVQDFNNILLALNLPAGTAAQVDVRMQYAISNSVAPVYSNVVTLTATPFALTSYIYVPGAYQGWHPSTADSLKSATGNGIYTGIINFTAGNLEFKLTPTKSEAWPTSYGDAGDGKISSTSSGNIKAPAAGQYLVTVDLNANTITLAPATYYSIIGDATAGGWDTDTDMKYDNGNEIWTVTTILKSSGGFKMRKNHAWDVSYGTIATPDGTSLTSANGGNISVPATGTYKITFAVNAANAAQATYTLTKQ